MSSRTYGVSCRHCWLTLLGAAEGQVTVGGAYAADVCEAERHGEFVWNMIYETGDDG